MMGHITEQNSQVKRVNEYFNREKLRGSKRRRGKMLQAHPKILS